MTLPLHDAWDAAGRPCDAVYVHTHRVAHDDVYRFTYSPGTAEVRVVCDFDYYECAFSAKVVDVVRTEQQLTLSEVACDIRNHWVELISGPATRSGGGVDALSEHLEYDSDGELSVLQILAAALFGGDPGTWRVTVPIY